jgi:epoxyqueuosine reductase
MNRAELASLAERHGLELVGVAPAEPLPEARQHLVDAVAAGRMATMEWMGGERPEIATDPRRLSPDARSVVVFAAPYVGADRAAWDPRPQRLAELLAPILAAAPAEPAGLVARYALGTDYHSALRERLQAVADDLRRDGIGSGEVAYVDDRPLAERAFAARGGLGWIGKNSNLLTHHRAGSYVFLGALLVSSELPADEPLRTSCGSCHRCIDGCPTGAIVGPQVIDARRCISYLTIEHPGELDAWSARSIGQWIFGCDVCQEVCPVNAAADDTGRCASRCCPSVSSCWPWVAASSSAPTPAPRSCAPGATVSCATSSAPWPTPSDRMSSPRRPRSTSSNVPRATVVPRSRRTPAVPWQACATRPDRASRNALVRLVSRPRAARRRQV